MRRNYYNPISDILYTLSLIEAPAEKRPLCRSAQDALRTPGNPVVVLAVAKGFADGGANAA